MNKNIYCSLNLGIYMELGVLFLRSEVAQTQRVFPTGKWDPKGRSQRNISGDSPAFPLGQIQQKNNIKMHRQTSIVVV